MPAPPPTDFVRTDCPARLADIAFSFLRPPDWRLVDLPQETVDFDQPERFAPLAIAVAGYGAILFVVSARPAYADGSVAQWLTWGARANNCDPGPIEHEQLGPHAAVACWGIQQSDDGTVLRARLAMFEDGGRLIQVTVMAPQALWLGVHDMLRTMLGSFALDQPRGPQAPLTLASDAVAESTFTALRGLDAQPMRSDDRPAAPAAAADAGTGTPAHTSADAEPAAAPEATTTWADLALADDDGSFDPEHPQNARMRAQGIGLVPRRLATDHAARRSTFGSGALVASVGVPFGWFVLDDGRRLLVYDPSGQIQINLDRRARAGADDAAILARLQAELQAQWPAARFLRLRAHDMECLAIRDVVVDGDAIEQGYLLSAAPDDQVLVARVTTAPAAAVRAFDLVELILRDLRFAGTDSSSTPPT